jgi:threonine synthase
MEMLSTRDVSQKKLSYTDVLLSGLAPDGGLYVPSSYPTFSHNELEELAPAPYEKIVYEIKRRLVGNTIPGGDLETLIREAYSESTFPRENKQVVPVQKIAERLFIQNLSLGPTASFKDMALQLLGREMAYELARRKESLVILGATSGDTGSAAEAAVKGLPNITLFMLSPEEGMSAFQRAQMGALSGGNIFNISIRGRFDDCQDLVKAVKQDPAFAKLGAVNSINWGRISSQIPYYFSGYFQLAKKIGEPIDVTVPSGNFGNMLSAYIAKKMGLPLRRLIVATNENNVLDTLFKTGVYAVTPAHITSSPSMDISKASNYERLVFDLFEGDAERVVAYMNTFAKTGKVSLSEYGLDETAFTKRGFESGRSTHANRMTTIQKVYQEANVVIDPHTADGVYVGRAHLRNDEVPMLCMSTALPVKFEDTVREALSFVPERPPRFAHLEASVPKDGFTVMESDAGLLKRFLETHLTI